MLLSTLIRRTANSILPLYSGDSDPLAISFCIECGLQALADLAGDHDLHDLREQLLNRVALVRENKPVPFLIEEEVAA